MQGVLLLFAELVQLLGAAGGGLAGEHGVVRWRHGAETLGGRAEGVFGVCQVRAVGAGGLDWRWQAHRLLAAAAG